MRCRFAARPCPSKSTIRRGQWKGSLGPRFIEWSLSFDLFFPLPLFHFGFWIRGPFSFISSLASSLPPPQLFLTFVVFCFPVLLPLYIIRSAALYISVALSHAYGCLSIMVQACYCLYTSLIPSFAAELPHSIRSDLCRH